MVKKAGRLARFGEAFNDAFGEGREEWTRAYRQGRKAEGQAENAPRWNEMSGAYPTGIRLTELAQDIVGAKPSPQQISRRQIREDLGIGIKQGRTERVGQLLGTAAADLTQDNTRNFYWLLNAAQATGNVIAESAMGKANPRLYGKSRIPSATNPNQNISAKSAKRGSAYLDPQGNPRKGVSIDEDGYLEKRNFEPGHLAALAIPTGIAINTGLGLMSPFGGAEGYWAAMPSQDDPTKTDNVLGEVALKYFMGKTGNLLPYDEFVKVRPDVSPEEYGQYQGWKYKKGEDWNPLDDGQTSMGAGFIRTTNDGIHGPELQFMGRSLPATTGLIPFIGALGGGIGGVRTVTGGRFGKFGGPIRGGVGGGMAGLAAGQVVGQLLEGERRRRNAIENESNIPEY
jgi:hypothetical protein